MADQWSKLNDMRLDCELCDVTFSVNGANFPAHRIVLSCCSRWLRSLLASSEGDGVIVLDSLDPGAVEAVVGYLYGEPLSFTPELSEEVIRVIRTFELDEVEVRCWKYLVGAVTTRNCMWLHRLADAYDCPALKWQAWRAIKQVLGDYDNQPLQVLGRQFEDDEEEEEGRGDKEDEGNEEEDDEDEDAWHADESRMSSVKPDEVPTPMDRGLTISGPKSKRARAKNVVMAWAHRLQGEWTKCEPELTENTGKALTMLKGELPVEFYRQRLVLFYEKYNPNKIQTVDEVLEAWEGKEDELLKAVVDKYKQKMEHDENARIYDEVHGGGVGADQWEDAELRREMGQRRVDFNQ